MQLGRGRWLAIPLVLVFGITSCASASADCEPDVNRDLFNSTDPVTLHLWVSNQSFDIDPVDIAVYIDDQQVVCDSFDVEGQHNWILFDVELDPGTHTLRALGNDGKTELTETIDVPDERWAVLDFWFYPEEEPERFTFSIHDRPVGFD